MNQLNCLVDESACVPHRYHDISDKFLHNQSIKYIFNIHIFLKYNIYIDRNEKITGKKRV